jgi:hypothetical protein
VICGAGIHGILAHVPYEAVMMANTLPVFVIDVLLHLIADAVMLLSVAQVLRLTTT